jgi:hypothetical protein
MLYHPNIDPKSGEICGDIIKFSPTKYVTDIAAAVVMALATPNLGAWWAAAWPGSLRACAVLPPHT